MKRMTWREFKQEVDENIKKLGRTEDVEIYVIDVKLPYNRGLDVGVALDSWGINEEGLYITERTK